MGWLWCERYPQHIKPGIEGLADVFAIGHFGGYCHSGGLAYFLEPLEAVGAYAFETSGACARLPDAGAEYVYALCGEAACRVQYLLPCLGAARAGDDDRAGSGGSFDS